MDSSNFEMDLGWLDTCLRVRDFTASQRFYSALGFQMVEGDAAEGWGVLVRGSARIGLFAPAFMEEDAFSLNFRGGNIQEVVEGLARQGIEPTQPAVIKGDRSGSAKFRDPDGNLVVVDSALGEFQLGPGPELSKETP